MLKVIVISVFIFVLNIGAFSQISLSGHVFDKETKQALAFCSIGIKGTNNGTITNMDGDFTIKGVKEGDILVFSFLGYEVSEKTFAEINSNGNVFLIKKSINLKEVIISAKDDYMYETIEKCRKQLLRNQLINESKIYFCLDTKTENNPLEVIECYYNGTIKGLNVNDLYLKNGRFALNNVNNQLFVSLNTSKSLCIFDITKKSDFFPVNPLQVNIAEMKKNFKLTIIYNDSSSFKIHFSPKADSSVYFNGDLWISKKNYNLLKVNLNIKNTKRHPFEPFLASSGNIESISMNINNEYSQIGDYVVPYIFDFKYNYDYNQIWTDSLFAKDSHSIKNITSTGLMYFYDYINPFILPYFDYDPNLYDYYKISLIPFNKTFWDNQNPSLLSKIQKQNLGLLIANGEQINFDTNSIDDVIYQKGNFSKNKFVNSLTYYRWSNDKRIILNENDPQFVAYKETEINGRVKRDLYDFKSQIMIDLNYVGDSIDYKTYTFFDPYNSFYHLPKYPITNTILNLYFDIVEIEKRKMDTLLMANHNSKKQFDSIYSLTNKNIERITNQFFDEVQLGKNVVSMRKWNDYVIKYLAIDNLKMFEAEIQPNKKDEEK